MYSRCILTERVICNTLLVCICRLWFAECARGNSSLIVRAQLREATKSRRHRSRRRFTFSVVVPNRNSHGVTSVRRSCVSSGFHYKKAIQTGKLRRQMFILSISSIFKTCLDLPFAFSVFLLWSAWLRLLTARCNIPCVHPKQCSIWADTADRFVSVSGKSGILGQMEGLLFKVSIEILHIFSFLPFI